MVAAGAGARVWPVKQRVIGRMIGRLPARPAPGPFGGGRAIGRG